MFLFCLKIAENCLKPRHRWNQKGWIKLCLKKIQHADWIEKPTTAYSYTATWCIYMYIYSWDVRSIALLWFEIYIESIPVVWLVVYWWVKNDVFAQQNGWRIPEKNATQRFSEKTWVQGTSKDPSLAFAPASRVWWHPRRTQSNQWEMHTVDMSIFGIIALAVSGTILSTKIHGRTNPPHHDGETKWSYIVCFLNQWPFSQDQEMICGWSVDDLWMIINLRCRNRLFNCSSTYA